MIAFFAYIKRLIVILCGFTLASIAASVFFVVVGVMPEGGGIDGSSIEIILNFLGSVLFFTIAVAAFSSMLLMVPAFILAIMSEYFCWNGLLFHGVSGAIFGGAATGLWHMSRTVEGESHLVLVGTAAGIIGACVYWWVAGRNSGKLFAQIIASRQN